MVLHMLQLPTSQLRQGKLFSAKLGETLNVTLHCNRRRLKIVDQTVAFVRRVLGVWLMFFPICHVVFLLLVQLHQPCICACKAFYKLTNC